MLYELKCIYTSRKSFYNKANVEQNELNNSNTLYSYNTKVCMVKSGKVYLFPKWNCSNTTLRHVKEFLLQHGFKAVNMRQIEKDYSNKNDEVV